MEGLAFHQVNQLFLLAGDGGLKPTGFNSWEQGEREPGLQPAEGRQARTRGVSGRGEPRGMWQPPKVCAGGNSPVFHLLQPFLCRLVL